MAVVQMTLTSQPQAGAHLVRLNQQSIGTVVFNGAGQWYNMTKRGEIVSAGHPSIHSAMLDLARHYLSEDPK